MDRHHISHGAGSYRLPEGMLRCEPQIRPASGSLPRALALPGSVEALRVPVEPERLSAFGLKGAPRQRR